MVRRNVAPVRANLFDDNQRPTWLVAEDSWRQILDLRALPVGTDLLRVFIVELLNYHDAGWRLSEFNAYSAIFFATKPGEAKRRIYITTTDPTTPKPLAPEVCPISVRPLNKKPESRWPK